MAIVVFDPAVFVLRYPEFSTVNTQLLGLYFGDAGMYLDNSNSGIPQLDVRASLLYMLTAHITALNAGVNGEAASPLVGKITQATEGSVSVTSEYATNMPSSMAWFTQTRYGAAFWQASARYRTFRYVRPQCGTAW
jgi:hypothetical protein